MVTGHIPRGGPPDGVGCYGLLVMIVVGLLFGSGAVWLMWAALAEFQP